MKPKKDKNTMMFQVKQHVYVTYPKAGSSTPHNFEAVVEQVVSKGDTATCPHCGKKVKVKEGWESNLGYYLDIPKHPNCCQYFRDHHLRIKHFTSAFSFKQLLELFKGVKK